MPTTLLSEWSNAFLPLAQFGLNWFVQSLVLTAVGLALATAARRFGSATQSAVYRTTLAAVLVAPLATALLGWLGIAGWSIRLAPATLAEAAPEISVPVVAPADPSSLAATSPANAAAAPLKFEATASDPSANDFAGRMLPPAPIQSNVAVELPQPDAVVAAEPAAIVDHPTAGVGATLVTLVALLTSLWIAAIGLSLAWLARSWISLHRLCRQSLPVDRATAGLCEQLCRSFRIPCPQLRRTPFVSSPCVVGVWSPTILLAEDLPESAPHHSLLTTHSSVLAHELAHVARHDCLWNLLRFIATSCLFPQPLLWYLSRRMEATAEEICDDFAVGLGADRVRYAEQLYNLAVLSLPAPAAAAVGMKTPRTALGDRIRRILDTSRQLSTSVSFRRWSAIAVVGIVLTALAGLLGTGNAGDLSTNENELTAVTPPLDPPLNGGKAEDAVPSTTSVAGAGAQRSPGDGALDVAREIALADNSPKSPAGASEAETITFRGQVLDPDGKPVSGAKIYVLGWYYAPEARRLPLAESKSGPDGRFEIVCRNPRLTPDAQYGRMAADLQTIAAVADGFGAGFVKTDQVTRGENVTLQLVRDDVPVAGRVLDLEGRPVAGVRVTLLEIRSPKNGNLTPWLESLRLGTVLHQAADEHINSLMPQFEVPRAAVVTDAAGRYRISGIGRERWVRLRFEGETIAYNEVDAVTKPIETIQIVTRAYDKKVRPLYGANLDLTVPPTQHIMGVVRDAETGQPLAGVTVANSSWHTGVQGTRLVRTVSDAAGKFRLAGLPKADDIELIAIPNDDQPFFMQEVKVPPTAGLEPVTLNFDLHRGLWITGRVTDKVTGEPGAANVIYFPFRTNEFAQQRIPEFGPYTGSRMGYEQRYQTRPDGTYRLVGLPGRAIVGVLNYVRPYRTGVGAEDIAGADKDGNFLTYGFTPGPRWPNSIKEINPPEGADSVTCDIQLDPGETIRVSLVDPDGKPITDASVTGISAYSGNAPIKDAAFEVICLGAKETRRTLIHHPERHLGQVVNLRLEDHPTRIATVKLEPCAIVTGRLLSSDGDPITGATVQFNVLPGGNFSRDLPEIVTDKEGRFRNAAVLCGCEYSVGAVGMGWVQNFSKKLAVKPGETIDLGDIQVKAGAGDQTATEKTPMPKAAADVARNKDAIQVRGRVLDADGKPLAGAKA